MVNKKYYIIFCFYFFSCHSFADKVVNIEIKKSGIAYKGRNQVEQEGCKLFTPTAEQLTVYFNQAERLEFGGWRGNKYYSPCIVTGKVTFESGKSGAFTLQSSGFGYGTFGGKEVIYFFRKSNAWFDPFSCSYSMGDEVEPGCE